jgi:uroporphyrinogen-III synthase
VTEGPRVAVFRPDDERMTEAVTVLESLGVEPVADPLLAVEPTGATPRTDADYLILTSKTGADQLPEDWDPGDATLCAIGERTARALAAVGHPPDLVPETYSSRGLLELLDGTVDGSRVEVARSDHGSDVLLDGLDGAGAYHHETVLYRLGRPAGSGRSAELAADGGLDAALFTSSLTVEYFLAAAAERDREADAVAGLNGAVVGTIGDPTRETAEAHGIDVDVVPDTASFEALARAAVSRLEE